MSRETSREKLPSFPTLTFTWKRWCKTVLGGKCQQKSDRQSGVNLMIPQTYENNVSASIWKPFIASSKQTKPVEWEIASSLPSWDLAKDKISSFVTTRLSSDPFSRLHKMRHFASWGQSVIIVLPEIEQAVKIHLLSGKRGFRSPSKVYA